MPRIYPNPVWINKNAVNPHNYKATAHSAENNHLAYARAAMKHGKTVGDLLAECLYAKRRREICDIK